MLTFLIRHFVKDYEQTDQPQVRTACGMMAGLLGIALNIILFFGKLLAGVLSASVAVVADAFNNLSDAGSSLITLIGFRMAGKKPDPSHPFGHGRIEYISGLIVSMIIILMGVELLKTSVEKIVAPESVTLNGLTAGILVASVAVKVYMCLYNRALAKKIDSAAMKATAMDSLSDSAATLAVLVAMLIGHFTGARIDGWAGLVVSGLILYAGYGTAKDTVNPLLGEAPDAELVEAIKSEVMAGDYVLGVHDLFVHDYGPGRRVISVHAEVPAEGDILAMHDAIDRIEQRLKEKLQCEAVIHMDPIVTDDERIAPLRAETTRVLERDIDPRVTVHDFRMVEGNTHTNLIFDVVIPFDVSGTEAELKNAISRSVKTMNENYFAVCKIDRG